MACAVRDRARTRRPGIESLPAEVLAIDRSSPNVFYLKHSKRSTGYPAPSAATFRLLLIFAKIRT